MIRKVFMVYDSKLASYEPPMVHVATGGMLRDWLNVNKKGDTRWAANPGDFTIFECGEFDDSTGEVKMKPKIDLGTLLQLQSQEAIQ